ncbi:leucyl/phenylalanyl-tRNA--protein transferase [Spirochaetia bacterium 38H-sp]|uniref:Leucyl/phenylalanyl-tRNA--protein transferase n=1 Tax=Rarispira pelagica TaxID=3141764 RepID=A0ABU9UB54_9SPIR
MPVWIPDIGELDHKTIVEFPDPEIYAEDGLVAVGGNLSPGMLISAYIGGSFPWFNSDRENIIWWSPDPRCVFYPGSEHVSKRLLRETKKNTYVLVTDTDFSSVIENCARIERVGQKGTWITNRMLNSYKEMHKLGYAHSVELYHNDRLIGGFYGLSIGSVFFGESMFSLVPHASKIAFLMSKKIWQMQGISLIDCQVETPHLVSMGAVTISRNRFLKELKVGVKSTFMPKKWDIRLIGNLLSSQEF